MLKNKKDFVIGVLFFVTVLVTISSFILPKVIENLDELWNYNFARNMANGLVPYMDFNMLQMPFLPMVTSLFLHVLGNELWVTRILGCILGSMIVWQFYQVLKNLKVNPNVSFAIAIAFLFLLKDYWILDYNFAILWIVLLILNQELKRNDRQKGELQLLWKQDVLIRIFSRFMYYFKTKYRYDDCSSDSREFNSRTKK